MTQNYKPLIPGYEILNEIERGTLSSLWSAIHVAEKRRVLIKVYFAATTFNPEDIDCNSRRNGFLSTLSDMIKCEHPALVRVYESGFMETGGYIVMEDVEGVQLSQRLEETGTLSESEAAKIGVVVAEALQEAWGTGIMHGNLKPANILIEADGTIRLMQTGFLQAVGLRAGSLYFMAPEQTSGELKMGARARSDQYGLGLVLYYALTGKIPFEECEADEAMRQQISGFVDDPRKICSGISLGMTYILAKMTAKSADDRYKTWDEVIKDLGNPATALAQGDQPLLSTIRIDQSLGGEKAGCLKNDVPSLKADNQSGDALKPASAPEMIGHKRKPVPRIKNRGLVTAIPRKKESQELFPQEWTHPRRLQRTKGGTFNIAASLVLMGFLGYYIYMRAVNDTDIIVPIRIKTTVLGNGLLKFFGFKITHESEMGTMEEASAVDAPAPVAADQVLSNDGVAKKSGNEDAELKSSQDPQENAKISTTKNTAKDGDGEEKESEVVASAINAGDSQTNSAGASVEIEGKSEVNDVAVLQKEAQGGDAQAQYQLGLIYAVGDTNLSKNVEKAVQWFQKAAEQGVPEAQFRLGVIYTTGDINLPKNVEKAAQWFEKAAEQGVLEAQWNIALCYKKGSGVLKNDATAVFWYRKLAEAGIVDAQCLLGAYSADGKMVKQDWREALKWYEKAASQGSETAKRQVVKVWSGLGMSLLTGQGANVNAKEAVDWLLKAAQSDNAPAQYNLGLCYANGRGTKVNMDQAIYWMRQASNKMPEANQWLKYNAKVVQQHKSSEK